MYNVLTRIAAIIILCALLLPACSTPATPPPAPTETPKPTSTSTAVPTDTSTPTRTPRPTATPNLAETQQYEAFNQEIESYYDQGFLDTTEGTIEEIDDAIGRVLEVDGEELGGDRRIRHQDAAPAVIFSMRPWSSEAWKGFLT